MLVDLKKDILKNLKEHDEIIGLENYNIKQNCQDKNGCNYYFIKRKINNNYYITYWHANLKDIEKFTGHYYAVSNDDDEYKIIDDYKEVVARSKNGDNYAVLELLNRYYIQ